MLTLVPFAAALALSALSAPAPMPVSSPAPVIPVISPAIPADDDGAEYRKLLEGNGQCMVTIRFVPKMEGEDMGPDEPMEIPGVMIGADGLVACSDFRLGGMFARMGRPVTPTDVKVLIGDDTEGKPARVLPRDPDVDLVWVKLDQAPSDLKFIDLAKAAKPEIGVRILAIAQLGKFFDRARYICEGRIAGMTNRPRKLYIPSDSLALLLGEPGSPVFSAAGDFIGIMIVQMPGKDADQGGGQTGRGDARVMILAAADLAKSTKHAIEEAAKAPPAEAPKPEAPKPEAPVDGVE